MDLSFDFIACTVTVYGVDGGYVVTRFKEDGSEAVFHPPLTDPGFIAASEYAGYGNPWHFAVEHDLLHAFVAQELGWPHSWSVWSAAHGTGDPRPIEQWSQRVKDDEHLTVNIARFLNTGYLDDYGCVHRAFPCLLGLERKVLALLQPLRTIWIGGYDMADIRKLRVAC